MSLGELRPLSEPAFPHQAEVRKLRLDLQGVALTSGLVFQALGLNLGGGLLWGQAT